eukprot:CAMPEP_0197000852 /NCGR_PEP_ID=MMETSP1380-20130617/5700_1 /TAXON_ID=5936 /ORGANISM="Euplotes crassus, Strain CT5" /LENGTH=362 /DNA_ID=CAMNT_0042418305 /DNA_START=75 /DNA_END=1163 /DNA_ORIENTATION=+
MWGAKDNPKKMFHDYYQSGAEGEHTLNTTRDAFNSIKLKARALGDADAFKGTETTFLGHKIASPICLAPTAFHMLVNPEGECATARAAAEHQDIAVIVNLVERSLEEVAEAAPDNLRILQCYFSRSDEVNKDIFERAEKAGYKALAVTVDTQILGNREADAENKFSLPKGIKMGTIAKYTSTHVTGVEGSGLDEYVRKYKHNGFTWKDILKIRQFTSLPIILKGIQCKEDAAKAVEYGADAIWVSNHGARQLDTTPASIEVLEECVQGVDGKIEVYFDGGVRRGTDVLKALALGASAVFIGRPQLWGLAIDGQKGVEDVLKILNSELQRAMILTDCQEVKDITKERVIHSAYCSPKYLTAKI